MSLSTAELTTLTTLGTSAMTLLGKLGWDKMRAPRSGNGSNGVVRHVLAEREEIQFQTFMKVMIEGLNKTLADGFERQSARLETNTRAMEDVARALHVVANEIVGHRAVSTPAIAASLETLRLVQEIHAR